VAILSGWCWLMTGGLAAAQEPTPGAMADQYAQDSRHNAELLRHYTWTMRLALTVKREAKEPLYYLMRYDAEGKLQKTLVIGQPPKALGRPGGLLARKKDEQFEKLAASLTDLVQSYMPLSPGTMTDFYRRAQFTPQPDGTVKASGSSVVVKGDSVVFVLDPASRQPRVVTFDTQMNGDAVHGTIQFGMLPHGPRYPAEITLDVPSRKVHAQANNSDYALTP
jgi:hypothetical protein